MHASYNNYHQEPAEYLLWIHPSCSVIIILLIHQHVIVRKLVCGKGAVES